MAAVKLAAHIFVRGYMVAPAGVCTQPGLPGCLDKMPSWLSWIAHMNPTEAVAILAERAHTVPESVYRQVETEYNAGITGSKWPGVAQLQPGRLALLIAGLKPANTALDLPVVPSVRASVHQGTFYYIGAGVASEKFNRCATLLQTMCTAPACCSAPEGSCQLAWSAGRVRVLWSMRD
jgi:hypothetical protein